MTTSTHPQSDHRPLIHLDPARQERGMQLIGCTCGWRIRYGTPDPEKALAVHAAIAMVNA